MDGEGLHRKSLMFFRGNEGGQVTDRMNVCLGSGGFVRTDADQKIVVDDLGRSCCHGR